MLSFFNIPLDTLANYLEVIGFILTLITLFYAFLIESKVNDIKRSYLFDNRVKQHIKSLESVSKDLNMYLNSYDDSINQIKVQLKLLKAEVLDISKKLYGMEKIFARMLYWRINYLLITMFVKRKKVHQIVYFFIRYPQKLIITTYNDIWSIYGSTQEMITMLNNIKRNKQKALQNG